ncbi:hypothetical protein FB567DRAFT_345103 [Paraphoma chrysanthemicola]|uniref:Uncharacterized protein n=1 Tax=Paraphoma chrysanthemicola TaxID=798071 RepID=A0A8K0R7K1_9PLEO|nr:hypothetical protein FB567DRAFT_345103 [Paraphoma chrysanthemicola]
MRKLPGRPGQGNEYKAMGHLLLTLVVFNSSINTQCKIASAKLIRDPLSQCCLIFKPSSLQVHLTEAPIDPAFSGNLPLTPSSPPGPSDPRARLHVQDSREVSGIDPGRSHVSKPMNQGLDAHSHIPCTKMQLGRPIIYYYQAGENAVVGIGCCLSKRSSGFRDSQLVQSATHPRTCEGATAYRQPFLQFTSSQFSNFKRKQSQAGSTISKTYVL